MGCLHFLAKFISVVDQYCFFTPGCMFRAFFDWGLVLGQESMILKKLRSITYEFL